MIADTTPVTPEILTPRSAQRSVRCAVVIVNYRTAELTCLAVGSALREIDASSDRVIVVDNASGDDSIERLRARAVAEQWGARVDIVASSRNGGFSAGNNLGIARVAADFYLLLNSDATLEPGALAQLLAALEEQPAVGIVGPAIRDSAGVQQLSAFRYRTPLGEGLEAADVGLLRRAFSRYDTLTGLDATNARDDIEWLSFACVLVRREVFERVGVLDEGFFLYFEDLDFCRRAREAGFELLYRPSARAVHDEGSSSEVAVALARHTRRPPYYYASRARYFGRYYGRAGLWLANTLRSAAAPVAWLRRFAGRDRGGREAAAEREWLDTWQSALAPIPARRLEPIQSPKTGRPFVLLDRDGTLVEDRGYTHRIEDYALLPGVVAGLKRLSDAGFGLAIVTNQSGIGRGYYAESDFHHFQEHLAADLGRHGIRIEASFFCPHIPEAGCGCRKPATGLIDQAQRALGLELNACWIVGDTAGDIGAATAAGCAGSVLVLTGEGESASDQVEASVPRAPTLEDAAEIILSAQPGRTRRKLD